eukprot:9006246-Alexandrium_andersonii.AAC.1
MKARERTLHKNCPPFTLRPGRPPMAMTCPNPRSHQPTSHMDTEGTARHTVSVRRPPSAIRAASDAKHPIEEAARYGVVLPRA